MATTKWLDPDNWTLAEWEDSTLTVFISVLWDALKGASDERQAFIEMVHSAGFDADKEFPDFNTLMSLFVSGSGPPNNAARIENAIDHTSGTLFDFVKTDTIKADGTAIASAEASYLTMSEILTTILGYASGTLLHMTDTVSGSRTGIAKMAWVKQWYQVMNYPQYYVRQAFEGTDDFYISVETRASSVGVLYEYNSVTGLIINVEAEYSNPPNAIVDLYVTNDLNETAPFSSTQDIWDYAVATLEGQEPTADWEVVTTGIHTIRATGTMIIERNLDGVNDRTKYIVVVTRREKRFKPNESFRALSPEKFQAALYFYFYITQAIDVSTFNAFGVGLNEDESKFLELTADVDGYYYLAPVIDPDFSLMNLPTIPTTTSSNSESEGWDAFALNSEGGNRVNDIFIEANNPDGTAFEYYSP